MDRLRLSKTDVLGLQTLELLGKGKYGAVYATDDGRVICKKMGGFEKGSNTFKQAYREYVLGVLGFLLIKHETTPNLVVNIACIFDDSLDKVNVTMYMERFEESLDKCRPSFRTPSEAVCLAYQVLHPIGVLASVFGVVHNDLYDRNVLINWKPFDAVYDVNGSLYHVKARFVASISDFGLCGSKLLDCYKCLPEMSAGLSTVSAPKCFGTTLTKEHILYFENLPPFSRDVYTILKSLRGKKFSLDPPALRWLDECLLVADSHHEKFQSQHACLEFMDAVFDGRVLSGFNIPSLTPTRSVPDYTFSTGQVKRLLDCGVRQLRSSMR